MKDLDTIYFAARELSPEDRPAYLTKSCEGDPELRARVEQMLAVADEAEAFITDSPDAELEDRSAVREAIKTTLLEPADTPDQAIGQKIGRYKILERLGEGGYGVVYVAEQTEPVHRRVALKVIKLGMDTCEVIARFEAERQALAMMDHPNIAKVFDAGTTETGRPFFIMELVRGIRITDYCDQANLSAKERLDLFIEVCQAIQHAHQKGIIHHDIKPGNILVTLHDGVPVPKVIDFGIAKATEGRLVDATVYTQLHQFMGTPAYMSPEQAEMSGLDVDTRSDTRLATLSEATKTTLQAQIWDVATASLIKTFPAGINVDRWPGALVFSSGGSTVVVGDGSGRIQVWNCGTGELKASILAHDGGYVMRLALSPDDTTLASSAEYTNTTIKLWELKTGRPLASLTNHQRHIVALAFSTDGKWLASGSEDQSIRLWDVERKQELEVLRGQWSGVWSLAFRSDGKTVASGGKDGSVCFWNVGPKVREKTYVRMGLGSSSGDKKRRAAFTPDSQSIVALNREDAIVRWDCATGLPLETLSAFGTNNFALLFSPSGRLLVVGDNLGNLKVWDWTGQRLVTNVVANTAPAYPYRFYTKETEFLSSAGGINTTWEVPAWRLIRSKSAPAAEGGILQTGAATAPDERTSANGFYDGTLRVTYSGTPPTRVFFKAHQAEAGISLAFSSDGKLLASGSSDETLKLWDAVTRTNLATMRSLSGAHSMEFSPNGRRIVTGYSSSLQASNVIYLWDIVTHRNMLTLPGESRGFGFVQFSPDGNALMAINDAGLLHLWRAPSW